MQNKILTRKDQIIENLVSISDALISMAIVGLAFELAGLIGNLFDHTINDLRTITQETCQPLNLNRRGTGA